MPGLRVLLPDAARYAGGASVGPEENAHWVPAKNRWSRVVLPFAGLLPEAWCTLTFRLAWDAAETADLDGVQLPATDEVEDLAPPDAQRVGRFLDGEEQAQRRGRARFGHQLSLVAVTIASQYSE